MLKNDLDDVRLLESLSARCWPATFIDEIYGWEIRRTPDVPSGRVNSVNAIAPVAGKFDHVLLKARDLFAEQDEWPLIRIHPLAGSEAVARLKSLGLQGEGHTVVKTLAIPEADHSPSFSCVVTDHVTPDWLAAYGDAHDSTEEECHAIARALQRVTVKQGFAVIYDEGRAIASGRGAVAEGWIGLFQIATVPEYRRRGFGRTLIADLLAWGRRNGANNAYLQVEAKNDAARSLYRSFGFAVRYDYSYWWLPDDIEIVNPTSRLR